MRKLYAILTGLIIFGIMTPACVNAQIEVSAKKQWVKTKIVLAKTDKVHVQASGTITLDPNVTCTADGLKIVSGPEHVILKGVNRGALLAKIGKKGVPFLAGSSGHFIPGSDGILFLGINDDATKNNAGVYTVTISVNGQAK